MFSLVHKQENAHTEGIWACAWGKFIPGAHNNPPSETNGTEDPEPTPPTENLPDSEVQYLVTGGLDDTVRVWKWVDSDDGSGGGQLSKLHTLEGHSLGVISTAVNPAGTIAASSSLDSTIKLWNLHTGEQMESLDCSPVESWSVVFSPCGQHVATGNHAGKINIYQAKGGEHVSTLDTRGRFTYTIAYSQDGKYIASGAIDGFINVFEVESGKLLHTIEGHAMTIRSITFSPDSQLLLTAADDGHMKLYDFASGKLAKTLSHHASWVLSVDFSPDQMRFVSSSSDSSVKVWDARQRELLHTFTSHTDQVSGSYCTPSPPTQTRFGARATIKTAARSPASVMIRTSSSTTPPSDVPLFPAIELFNTTLTSTFRLFYPSFTLDIFTKL
ncbi:WD repeat-containing protein 61 isoform X1 [Hyalella azteca]|uniref:WD repeat-containing protein 61 isoform X1 n=1 Tax=Hyalella azteca TaxID=294128 RepID=A0A979FQ93_HYAAZ|nr:WD repeat-containing protein 61 isoform X1 [Hyalella azteca]